MALKTYTVIMNEAQLAFIHDLFTTVLQDRIDVTESTIRLLRKDHTYMPGEQNQDIVSVVRGQGRYLQRVTGDMLKGKFMDLPNVPVNWAG